MWIGSEKVSGGVERRLNPVCIYLRLESGLTASTAEREPINALVG